MNAFIEISPLVFRHRHLPQCYLINAPDGYLLINPGPLGPEDLQNIDLKLILLSDALIHHACGAMKLKWELGAQIFAPESEQSFFVEAERHNLSKPSYNLFDTYCDYEFISQSIAVDEFLADHSEISLLGLRCKILPTPCASYGAVSYIFQIDGENICFSAELICADAKIRRLKMLQYTFHDARGLICTYSSIAELARHSPSRLFPSFAEPILNPLEQISRLQSKISDYFIFLEGSDRSIKRAKRWDIKLVAERVYYVSNTEARTHFIQAQGGQLLALDMGKPVHSYPPPGREFPGRYRSFLPDFQTLNQVCGNDLIEKVLLTHHHNDHISGLSSLCRTQKTEILAGEHLTPVLKEPDLFNLQCLSSQPLSVTSLKLNRWYSFYDIEYFLVPISGHTQYSNLIFLNVGKKRICHIGDAFFFLGGVGFNYGESVNLFTNHIYQDGASLESYLQIARHLLQFKPDLILTGHSDPYTPDERFYEMLVSQAERYKELHLSLLPLDRPLLSLGMTGKLLEVTPYRVAYSGESELNLTAVITNPSNTPLNLKVFLLDSPVQCVCEEKEVSIEPASCLQLEICIEFNNPPDQLCGRVTFGGRDEDSGFLGVIGHFLLTRPQSNY